MLVRGAGASRSALRESTAGPTLGRESDMDLPRVVHLSLLNLTFLTGYFLLFYTATNAVVTAGARYRRHGTRTE